jgi:tetratricopeptide (TPR) repeat protein
MELVYDILKKLKNYEIRQVRNFLKASPFEYEKVGKLFDLVTRYKDKDEAFFSEKLYGSEPNNTFRVTKSRLKRLLEDVVLNDKSLGDYSAEYINSLLQSKKRLLQGEILLGRGAYLASRNILLQVITTTRKFSLHSEYFQASLLLHRNQSINLSVKEFQKKSEELIELNRITGLVNEAAILHYSVTNVLTSQTISDKEELASIESKVNRIGEVAEITSSPLAKYYFYLSKILLLQYNFQYAEALEYCKLQLDLIKEDPAVHSQQRLGSAYFQLTETSLRQGDLEEAQRHAESTLAFFSEEETNYLIVLQTAFHIAFFASNFAEAQRLAEKALKHPRFEVSKLRAARWHYLRACLFYRMGKIKESLQTLNEATALLQDRLGWNLSFRLLEIILLHEAGHHDLLETKILNLKQFVKRTHQDSETFRPMTLISILMEWHKQDYDFKKTLKSAKKKLEGLESFHKEVPFDPNSGELVRLEFWMKEKAK